MAIRDDDQFLVNRQTKSYKTTAHDLVDYLNTGGDGISGGSGCDPSLPNPCSPGFECQPDGNGNGICVQIPCNPSRPCPANHICYNGFCYEICGNNPEAGSNGCLPGYDCIPVPGGNICYPSGGGGGGNQNCTDDSDCPFPFECDGSDCVPIDCVGNPSLCPPGSDCVDGILCLQTCDEWHACPNGFTCVDGNCWPTGGGENNNQAIGDGRLIFTDVSGDSYQLFSANQKVDSTIQIDGDITDNGNGSLEININSATAGQWEAANDTESGYTLKIRPKTPEVNAIPNGNANLGTPLKPWTGVYANDLFTGDLHLSNEGKSNDVDGTWGDWTIQEGEDDLYLLNNRTGKKFAFVLKPID